MSTYFCTKLCDVCVNRTQTSVQYFCGESCVITEASIILFIIIAWRQRNQHWRWHWFSRELIIKDCSLPNSLGLSTIVLGLFSEESWIDFLKNKIAVETAFGFCILRGFLVLSYEDNLSIVHFDFSETVSILFLLSSINYLKTESHFNTVTQHLLIFESVNIISVFRTWHFSNSRSTSYW